VVEGQSIENLIRVLMAFPGVGRRSAERMVYFLMIDPSKRISVLTEALHAVSERVRRCRTCNGFAESDLCSICSDPRRDETRVCVVAEPRDLDAIERTGIYRGLYHVLDGLLSPLDGIGPRELSIEQLLHRIQNNRPEEILMALSSTVEGDATTSYIIDLLKSTGISLTRLARGVPAGGSLEYLDTRTLSQALTGREHIVEQ